MRTLIRHAYHNVPLWRSLFDQKNIAPEHTRTLHDLSSLPVTSKKTFIGKMPEEYTDNSRMPRARWYVTSGTSGTPFRFLMADRDIIQKYADFASLRFLWWRGEPLRYLSNAKVAWIRVRRRFGARNLFVSIEDFFSNPRESIAKIEKFSPDILATYPSILLEIARRLSEDPTLPRPKPRFVLSFGEMLSPSVRELASRTFDCEVYDRYGLEEVGVVGVECAAHDGFHINTESVIVEITDDAYTPIAPGKEGRIVATSLANYNMPFIHYDTGDKGSVSYEPCSCGLRSPRIWIRGRYSLALSFPQRVVHHLEFDGAMDGFMNAILQYQMAKKSDREIVARIVPGPAFREEVCERVRAQLNKLVGPAIRVNIEVVQRIPPTSRGKCRILVDESLTNSL